MKKAFFFFLPKTIANNQVFLVSCKYGGKEIHEL